MMKEWKRLLAAALNFIVRDQGSEQHAANIGPAEP
jgi:hypothetical protein